MANAGDRDQIDAVLSLNLDSRPVARPMLRGQHPKHHGCAKAIFRIRADIPEELRQGVFCEPRDYDAWVRFSNGRVKDDSKADAHGMAIKVLGVSGTKLLDGRTGETAQDFILVDSETFFTGDGADYIRVHRATMGKGIDRLFGWLSLLCRPALLMRILRFAGKRPRSPFECRYFSAVPYRFGSLAVKYAALPRGPVIDGPASHANALAAALQSRLNEWGISFAFAVDIQADPDTHPIDDPTVNWAAAGARRVVLAELILPPQSIDPSAPLAENLQFSPWHALLAHEPLGLINRMRKPVYREMARARHQINEIVPLETSEAPASYADQTPGSAP